MIAKMVPEEKRLAIEMGAKRFRIDVQKRARRGLFAEARTSQRWCYRPIC